MIKVMLIDDETPYRTMLKELISWRQHGFDITGEAANGKAALELIANIQPDLLIVDMNMPLMSGAELIETVASRWPRIKSIGLSSYDDYDYLRQSMKSGAIDYLLKHQLDAQSLLTALKNAASILTKEEQDIVRVSTLESQFARHKQDLQQQAIMSLLHEDLHIGQVPDMSESFRLLDLDLPLMEGSLLILLIDQAWKLHPGNVSGDPSHMNPISSVLAITSEILREYGSTIFQTGENQFVIFLAADNRRGTMAMLDRQNAVIQRIRTSLQRFLNLEVSIYAGAPYHGPQEIRSTYQQLLELTKDHFYEGSGKIKFAAQINKPSWQVQQDSISLDVDVEKKLTTAVRSADKDATTAILETYFTRLYEQRLSNRSFKIICIELIHLLGRILRDMNLTSEPKSYDPMDAYDRINRFDTMEALKTWLIEKFTEVIHFIRLAGCHERHSPVVSKALSYIQTHFNQPITLSEAAESAGVSHTYLSRAFKEEIGKGFSEYLTHYRIEHACQLISSGGMRLKDIATACGFSQYTYFFKVFKQTTGLTPNEYWNKH